MDHRTIKSLHRRRNKLYRKQKKSQTTKDRHHCLLARQESQKHETQSYWRYITDIIEDCDKDSIQPSNEQKRFWGYIKALKRDNS